MTEEITRGTKKASNESIEMTSNRQVDRKAALALTDLFHELKWKFKPTKRDAAILDKGHLPDSAKKVVAQASEAQEKLCKSALQLTTKQGAALGEELNRSLKDKHAISQKHLSTLHHLLNFAEFPDNPMKVSAARLDDFLLQVATDTQKFNEAIHQAMGLLKARAA